MIPLWKMHTACDAAPRKAQTLEEHLKQYHKGQMPKGECKFIKQWKKDHPEDFAATKSEDDTETASKNAGASGGGNDDAAQRDAEYLKAVKAGDTATCARMVAEAAQRAMPNTKVVGADGSPKAIFHGTDSDFTTFKTEFGAWFSNTKEQADYYKNGYGTGTQKVISAYVNLENPLVLDVKGRDWNDIRLPKDLSETIGEKYAISETVVSFVKYGGKNDGVVFKNIKEEGFDKATTDFVALDPKSIKSADPITYDDAGKPIPLSKRFDLTNPDYRY